jgi:hypothetical protein
VKNNAKIIYMYDKNDSKNMILYVLYVKNDKMIPLINLFRRAPFDFYMFSFSFQSYELFPFICMGI